MRLLEIEDAPLIRGSIYADDSDKDYGEILFV